MRDAVVLLSGGLDSYTAAAIARAEGFRLFALTLRYGQRHARELEAARAVAAALGVERHVELDVDLSVFGGSSLTTDAPVPKDRPIDPASIPSTYVPARNTVFLALVARMGRGARRRGHLHRRQRARLLWISRLSSRVHCGVRTARVAGDRAGRRRRPHAHSCAAAAPHQGRNHSQRGRRSASTTGSPTAATTLAAAVGPAAGATVARFAPQGLPQAGIADPALLR